MVEVRRFTRLRPGPLTAGSGAYPVPEEGLCLSTFLLLHPPAAPRSVLLGRVDPGAPWSELGALDAERVRAIADRWMLPSSQLLFFESPEQSARRIAREQLDADLPPVDRFSVFSEAYSRPHASPEALHWDFHFVFDSRWPSNLPPRASAWRELRFRDVGSLRAEEIARSQGDVLALAGLAPGTTGPEEAPGRPASGSARTRRR